MGRTIMYEPALLASGFTLSGEDSFILGPEAFSSEEELIKTLLHELFRLATSVVLETKTATTTQILAETNAAFEFAERAFKSLIGGEQ